MLARSDLKSHKSPARRNPVAANLTLARRDIYLEYLRTVEKHDTLTAPLHIHSLFPDQLLLKAEKLSRSQERHSCGNSHMKPCRFHHYASSATKSSHQPDWKAGLPVWKQISDCQQGRKGHSITV